MKKKKKNLKRKALPKKGIPVKKSAKTELDIEPVHSVNSNPELIIETV